MTERKPIESWLTDMDGVLMHEGVPVPGAEAFIKTLREKGRPFLVLTNNSIYTARDLHARLNRIGLDVPVENIWTSALATAAFLDNQHPGGTAYVIGEAGLTTALHDAGYVLTDSDPDFVILGETRTYSFEALTKAIRLINDGARFIATNPDNTGPSPEGALLYHRFGGRADHQGDRQGALLRRQAEPADDAVGAEHHRRALGEQRHDRRPDGHGRTGRAGGRDGDLPRPHRADDQGRSGAVPVPAHEGRGVHRGPGRPDLT